MEKKLVRNTTDSMLGGVASGMALYFDIDKTLVRILWVASLLLPIPPSFGLTFFIYLILWAVLPDGKQEGVTIDSPSYEPNAEPVEAKQTDGRPSNATQILGIILLGLGVIMLAKEMPMWYRFNDYLWPMIFIGAGAFVLLRHRDAKESPKQPEEENPVIITPPPTEKPATTAESTTTKAADIEPKAETKAPPVEKKKPATPKPPKPKDSGKPDGDDVIKVN